MGSVSLGKVIALTQATVKNNPNPMQVQSSYVFVDEVARDTYFAINFADLEKDKTYIYIENSSDLQVWSGDTNPASYIANWSSRIGFIKGDKGDSGSVGQGVNPAGLTGQVLKKSSNTNYDTEWDYIASGISNNDILIALGGELADSGKKFNDLGITINDIWSANQVIEAISNQVAKTLELKGNWDANTNTPDLDNISEGEAYIVSVAGTNYGYDFEINDWIVKTDTGYAKINNNLANVIFDTIGGNPLDNPALALEFDKYINKIATVSTGNLPKITADGQIEDSGYAITDLFTKDLTEYIEKTVILSNNDKMLVKDESTGLWKYSRIDKIPSASSPTVKVSDTDTIEGYLLDKIVGTTNYIVLTKLNEGVYEQIQIEIGSNVFDKSTNTSDDITEGTTNLLMTTTERTLVGVLTNTGDGISFLANDGTYKAINSAEWGNITGDITSQTDLNTALGNKENTANKNQANGYVGLDGNTKIDIAYIPNAALERLIIVSDEVARFALTTVIAQNGDVVKQQDVGSMFYIVDDTNLNNANGYLEFSVGIAGAVEWSNILNKPSDIFYTSTMTTDDVTEGTTNLFDKTVTFTEGKNIKITGIYPNFTVEDTTNLKSYGVIIAPTITKEVDGTITLNADGVISFNTQVDGLGATKSYTLAQQNLSLTPNAVNYVYADYNNGSPVYAVSTSSFIFTSNATYSPIVRATVEFDRIHFTEYDEYGTALSNKLLLKDIQINSFTRIEGLSISEKNTRELVIAAGRVNIGVENYHLLEFDSLTHDMYEYYKTAGIWQSSKVTALDSTYYCDGTNRQTLSNNKYVAKYIFRDVGDDLQAYFVHGNQKSSVEECRIEEVPALPTTLLAHAIYVGKIVYQKNSITGTVFTRTWGQTVQSVSPTSHNDLGDLELAGAGVTYGHISDSTTTSVKDLAITDAVNGNLIDKSSLTNTLTNIENITTDLQRQEFYTLPNAGVLIKTMVGTSTFVCKIEYHLYSMSFEALRTGIVKVLTDGITYTISDNADGEIGDTSDISFTANMSGTDCSIYVTNAGLTSYIIKTTVQDIKY